MWKPEKNWDKGYSLVIRNAHKKLIVADFTRVLPNKKEAQLQADKRNQELINIAKGQAYSN